MEQSLALRKFLEMVRGDNYLVLDTETTGLKRGEICQIAIVDSLGVVQLSTLIKTVNPIPPAASDVHGITDDMVKDAPTWNQIAHRVRELITDRDLIVHNAIYDRKMMHQSAEAAGMEKVEWKEVARWHCAMEMFAEYYGDWNDYHGSYRWQRLQDAAHFLNTPKIKAHDAVNDCLMTLAVVKAMAAGVFSRFDRIEPVDD